ncbi:granzyme B-like [Seriola dumerili]|uniref:trypsin n=1 Tax=Seriola dumerili TaxID=41447 RepID=A0A3B4THG4_SERDU|nr:granzyme B-like [Seriola dumerili]XP_022615312.1 granzyme B-like [Seriola dumerili]
MFSHRKLVTLMLALTLHGQVYTGKIFGGHEAVPHSRPHMVLLEQHMEEGRIKHCGGFLLNEDFVMTAAHCQAKSYKVLLGLHDVRNSKEIQHVFVEEAFPHKEYDEKELKNDIMLLKLKSKAHFNKNVKPIALAGQDDESLPKSCIVSGWGRSDKVNRYMTPILMEVNVTLIDNEWCTTEKLYCSKGENGPAEGDSGGPLVCEDGKAYGVVSASGILNSDGTQIYCFTKIPDYRNWIDGIIGHIGNGPSNHNI